ncbi:MULTISPECIES: cell division protein FtsZ [Myroides]|uniref:Cell division protein FtsZ n=1 Tax=Myroides albus TaxID=2562892 RepID=A0A6I3LKP6_9FLAO|nr:MULTISPECIES: cell division protein FtsZ [Myroides]MTG98076.1 cell division protein FtsZ [Myroides albus]MVX36286.1 cell division protein FtsZ [Myroides sp. LoEW2-1]UVD80744.1 cell division protein FtsZ [Myroides albus]
MENTDFGGIKFDLPKNQSNVIKVIGVGGGGSNAINHMFKQGIKGVDFIVCNTDSQALENSPVPNKIQLGVNLTEGLGAGANPEVGQQSAIESIEDIEKMLDTNTKMVFITAGMGGGTGTGAAPVIAQLSKERDILTVGIVTIPFQFEGKVRQEQALKGVERLRKQVDSLVVINNNKLREVYGNLGFKAGFSKADEVLSTAARGIAEVITHHYTQNIDLKDAKTVLSDSGTAIMGSATASGDSRAKNAIVDALDSPLLNDNKITGAKNVLLLIVSGSNEITLDEIGEINDHIQTEAGHNANIIMGVGEDESLGEAISVTIIATGFNVEQQKTIVASGEPKVIVHTLGDEQTLVRNLSSNSVTGNLGFSTPDQPLTKTSDSAVSPADAPEERKVFTLEAEDEFENDFLSNSTDISDEPIVDPTISDDGGQFAVNFESVEPKAPIQTETSPAAKNLDVFFEIVTPQKEVTPEVVNSTQETKTLNKAKDLRDIKVVDPEFVIVTKKIDDTVQVPTAKVAQTVVYNLDDNTNEFNSETTLDIQDQIDHSTTEDTKEEFIYFSLEDYTDKEEELKTAKPNASKHAEDIAEGFKVSMKENEDEGVANVESPVTAENDEINPMEMSIEEFTLRSRSAERRKKMRDFNYKFNSGTATNSQINDLESEPAYKRTGVNLNEVDDSSQKSRTSISLDSNNDSKLRSNNSFLHDNVD